MVRRLVFYVVAVGVLNAMAAGMRVVATDPLVWLYADSQAANLSALTELDVPSNGIADVNLFVENLLTGLPVRVSASGADGGAWFRARTVPVTHNTGLEGFLEKPGKPNPHVTRRAPFDVFDVLEPMPAGCVASARRMEVLRFRVASAPLGVGVRKLVLSVCQGETVRTCEITLRIHPVALPPVGRASFKYTNWLNFGNMATRHGLTPWSDAHWAMIERYLRLVVSARQNMLLVPQALMFERDKTGAISFPQARFARLLALCDRVGIWYLEGPHLAGFSNGWSSPTFHPLFSTNLTTTAVGEAQLRHLADIVRQAVGAYGLADRWYQHVADEPSHNNAPAYVRTAEIVRTCLPGIRITDAVEQPGFESVVDAPCPKNHVYEKHRTEFCRAREKPWCYTCCFPGGRWMNRLLDGELLRPTLLPWVCTLEGVDGFLHWGGNQYQHGQDPFVHSMPPVWKGGVNCPTLPPGDTHVIYPGPDAPWPSVRLEAMRAGMEDAELLLSLRRTDPARADALVRRIARGFGDYEADARLYRTLRRELLLGLVSP